MNLPSDLKDYKVSVVDKGSKKFFTENPAQNWNFLNYFPNTHQDCNKWKKFSTVKSDFEDDLHRIVSRLNNTPEQVAAFAHEVI